MKRLLFIFTLLIASITAVAQSEVKADSVRSTSANKQFENFFLDFDIPSVPQLPKFDPSQFLGPDMTKDYSMLFQPDESWSFGHSIIEVSSPSYVYGTFASPQHVQMGTIKLNEKMTLGVYGQYTVDGKRLPGTNLFPWDKNNFIGGMELKFNNNFGIRVEVRQGGKNPMYPY